MREILFRGKRIDNGEWVEATGIDKLTINLTGEERWFINSRLDSSVCVNEQGHITWIEAVEGCAEYRIDPETLGQYTGLTDKNGRKIFEGDICQIKGISYIDETPFVVEWNEEYCGWFWRNLDFSNATDTITPSIAKRAEVIGNIHDNPELLGGEENAAD